MEHGVIQLASQELKRDEIETFLEFVQIDDEDRKREARAFQLMIDIYEGNHIPSLLEMLDRTDTSGSFAVLGRDADEQGSLINDIDDAGHDVVLHGYRHAKFAEMEYDQAHEHISTGLDAIEDASGIRPTGFFAPFKDVSAETLEAAEDLDIEWILGRTEADVPDSIDLFGSVYPHDARKLVGEGKSPAVTFDELQDLVEGGQVFLYHPSLLEYYDAMDEFEEWLDTNAPVKVSSYLSDGSEGLGLMIDSTAPIRIR